MSSFEAVAKGVGYTVITVIVFGLIALAIGYPVKWLANYLFTTTVLQAIFGIPQLTFWKAFWLSWFISLLFKGGTKSGK